MDLTRRNFLKSTGQLAFGMSMMPLAANFANAMSSKFSKRPPNIIFILADDLGWGDLGCYGNRMIKTPAIDRLAKKGIRFTHAYMSGTVCSPARAALMTGKYPAKVKVHGHFAGHDLNAKRAMTDWLDRDVMTIARLFQQKGYKTAHIGKWHLGGTLVKENAPTISDYGFDYTRGSTGNDPNEISLWRPKDRPISTKKVMDETLKFIEENKDTPFYVNAWLVDPHAPLNPSEEQMDEYKWAKPTPSLDYEGTMRVYFGTVTEMDKQIGIFLEKLEDMGLAQDTIIVFSSDNGPEDIRCRNASHSGIGSPGPFRGVKRSLYEGGMRVPFIVSCPGKIPQNVVDNKSIITGVDYMPSICQLAGIPVPDDLDIDGVDMSKAFVGKPMERPKPHFWEWRFLILGRPFDISPTLAMRDGKWKLLMNHDQTRVELYDIIADPAEMTNLADDEPKVLKQMKKQLLAWKKTLPEGPCDPGVGKTKYPWPEPLK